MQKTPSEKTLVLTFQKNMNRKGYKILVKSNSLIVLTLNPIMSIPIVRTS